MADSIYAALARNGVEVAQHPFISSCGKVDELSFAVRRIVHRLEQARVFQNIQPPHNRRCWSASATAGTFDADLFLVGLPDEKIEKHVPSGLSEKLITTYKFRAVAALLASAACSFERRLTSRQRADAARAKGAATTGYPDFIKDRLRGVELLGQFFYIDHRHLEIPIVALATFDDSLLTTSLQAK